MTCSRFQILIAEAEKIHIFHFRISFPFHPPVSPPPQKILVQRSSGSPSLAGRCIWLGIFTPSVTPPLCVLTQRPGAWLPLLLWLLRNPRSAREAARLPTALPCGDALETNTVIELTGEFFWRAWEAHRNRRSFSVSCFHESTDTDTGHTLAQETRPKKNIKI